MRTRRLWPYALFALVMIVNITVFTQRVWIMDWLQLRSYDAPAPIATLVSETSMTPYAERLFYVNHPALEDKTSFNQHCADHLEQGAVLGCYHGNRQGIYVYDVSEARLHGVEQVTAAHEMLHQAYDRLDGKEKERIRDLLQAFNDTQLTDENVKEKLELYRQADTVDLINEMHSIFATEIAVLPTGLEDYYRQYFTDRQKVVAFSQRYRAEFDKLEAQVKDYDHQLTSLEKNIEVIKRELAANLETIRAKERQLQQSSKDDTVAYNAEVRAYNRMVDAYNAKVEVTRAMIDEYNAIVAKRNDIAFAERQLQQALDSRLTPVTQ